MLTTEHISCIILGNLTRIDKYIRHQGVWKIKRNWSVGSYCIQHPPIALQCTVIAKSCGKLPSHGEASSAPYAQWMVWRLGKYGKWCGKIAHELV